MLENRIKHWKYRNMWKPAEVTGINCNTGIMTDPFCFCILINSSSNDKKTMLNFPPTSWNAMILCSVALSDYDILPKCKNFASVLQISSYMYFAHLPSKKDSVIFCILSRGHTPTRKRSLHSTLFVSLFVSL